MWTLTYQNGKKTVHLSIFYSVPFLIWSLSRKKLVDFHTTTSRQPCSLKTIPVYTRVYSPWLHLKIDVFGLTLGTCSLRDFLIAFIFVFLLWSRLYKEWPNLLDLVTGIIPMCTTKMANAIRKWLILTPWIRSI